MPKILNLNHVITFG